MAVDRTMLTLAGDWMRPCRDCGRTVTSAGDWLITTIRAGRVFRKSECRACAVKRSVAYDRANPESAKAREARRCRNWGADTKKRVEKTDAYFRERNIRAKFGISLAEYEQRFEINGGICSICSQPLRLSGTGGNDRAALDHDHKTGKIRDFLCNRCNVMLGMAQDDCSRLAAAILYLEQHGSR